jgi:uncharacterized membrane protein YhaH (DUF805 family)
MLRLFGWALFSFQGRMGRASYFLSWLAIMAVSGVLDVGALGRVAHPEPPSFAGALVRFVIAIACLWGHLAIQVKRFHDFDWSGWWVLAPGAALIGLLFAWIGGVLSVAGQGHAEAGSAYFGLGALTLVVVAFIVGVTLMLFFRSGTVGPNDYGPRAGPPGWSPDDDNGPTERSIDEAIAAAARRMQAESPPSYAPATQETGERTFGRRGLKRVG